MYAATPRRPRQRSHRKFKFSYARVALPIAYQTSSPISASHRQAETFLARGEFKVPRIRQPPHFDCKEAGLKVIDARYRK